VIFFVYVESGPVEDYRAALDIYKKYHEENPDDVETYYHLGMAYGKTGNSGESHCNFGTFFKKQNKPERALFHLEAALGYFPQNSKRAEEIKKEMDLIKKQKDRRKPSPPDRADGNGNAKRPYYPHHSIFRQP
jgi:tetratricopeptide (TPR) repeat protein